MTELLVGIVGRRRPSASSTPSPAFMAGGGRDRIWPELLE
jgi:hypothetical protein